MPIGAAIVDRCRAVLAAIGERDDLRVVGQQILFHGVNFEVAEIPAEGNVLVVVDRLAAKYQDGVFVDRLAQRGNRGSVDWFRQVDIFDFDDETSCCHRLER